MCARNVRKWFILNNLFPNSSKTKLLNITLKPFIFTTIFLPLILQLLFQVIVLNLLE